MKELYGKGLATHPDPESCAGHGNVTREALTFGTRRQATELRNHSSGVPTGSRHSVQALCDPNFALFGFSAFRDKNTVSLRPSRLGVKKTNWTHAKIAKNAKKNSFCFGSTGRMFDYCNATPI
jgi:hypothetical protein